MTTNQKAAAILVVFLILAAIVEHISPILVGFFTAIYIADFQSSGPILEPKHDPALVAFMHMKANYLKSPAWNNKRLKVLGRAGYVCEKCRASSVLYVHHVKDYRLIPNEPLTSLAALCGSCHTSEHEKHGYPQTYEDYMFWDHPLTKDT